jgi:hypothetical protein
MFSGEREIQEPIVHGPVMLLVVLSPVVCLISDRMSVSLSPVCRLSDYESAALTAVTLRNAVTSSAMVLAISHPS